MTRRVPDKDKLADYLARGLTHRQMADAWFAESGQEVQRSTISMALARYELVPSKVAPLAPEHERGER